LSPPDRYFDPKLEDFPWQDYATVRIGRSSAFPHVDFVTSAQSTNAMLAFDAMRERGYQRIGLVSRYRRRRVFGAGFLWAQFKLPTAQQIPVLTLSRKMEIEQQRNTLKKWMDETSPDALLADIHNLPELLKWLGYRVPNDVAIATTNLNESTINAGINQKPEVIGKTAVRTLAELLHSQTFGISPDSCEILVKGQWTHGSMLPDCN
jgi:LacI family transcriptional regulator